MIFDLPPVLGILPVIVYVILTLRGFDIYLATIIGVVMGAIFTQQTLVSLGNVIFAALGSFLALVGFIIMMGSGLGEVLKRTKIAHNIVNVVLEKTNIKSTSQGIFITMIISMILVAMLGTVAGSNAIIAPIVIPILASLGTSPGTLGIAFFGGGFAGLIIGPFTPNVVTILGLVEMSYLDYLLCAGLPLAIIIFVVSYLMALRHQKTDTTEQYTEDDKVSADFEKSPAVTRGSIVFLILMILLLAYGVYAKAGASYSIIVMFIVAFACALAVRMPLKECVHSIMDGCARMYKMFFMFVLFQPFIGFISESGAFDAIAGYLQPLVDGGGQVIFMVVTALIGIFGISGSSVAQSIVIHELFYPSVLAIGSALSLWVFNVMIGSILTSFAMPGVDNIGALALARSNNLKAALKMGYAILIVAMIVLVIRSIIGI